MDERRTPREPAPDDRPVALTVAGSDSGGGAGIQADLKAMEAHGVFGTSAVTAVTAQNTVGVASTHVLPVEEIAAQIDAVLGDFAVDAVKTGMLATAPVVETVADYAADLEAPLVVDPVMVAASGDRLLDPAAEDAYEALLGEATLATPNADEAEVLTGTAVTDRESARRAGEALRELGADAALLKGGHVPGETVRDVLVTADGVRAFEHPRVDTEATHGSGCALASAIAAELAHGADLEATVRTGTDFLQRAVRYHLAVGEGPGSVHHMVGLRNDAARTPTGEAVEGIVETLVERDASPLVPEVGMNVVGATPYAEGVGETAAVEGRIARTMSGVRPVRGVRFGASSHVARFLLAAREFDPELRFALNCRLDDDVEAALDHLDAPVTEVDRTEEPPAQKTREGGTMEWTARRAFGEAESAAVLDRGDVGKEPMVRLVAPDAPTARDRALTVLEAVR